MTLAHRYPNIPAEEFTLHNVTLLGILIFSTLAVTQPYSNSGVNISVSFSPLGTFGASLSSEPISSMLVIVLISVTKHLREATWETTLDAVEILLLVAG